MNSAIDSGAAELELDGEIPLAHEHPAWATLKRLFHHRAFLTGLGLFGIILLAAAFAHVDRAGGPDQAGDALSNSVRPVPTSRSGLTISVAACGRA